MGLLTIKNNTAVAQSIIFKGRQIILDGQAEESFDEAIGQQFLDLRRPLVTKVVEPVNTFGDNPADMVWVANRTGDPDAPKTVNVRHWANRSWSNIDIENPKAKPITIKRDMDGGMQSYTAKDGALEMLNLGKTTIAIPPYQRRLLPKNVATWSLTRDAVSSPEMRGAIAESRAPGEFEPSVHWQLDDIRSYLRLIDPRAAVGPSEQETKKEAEKDPNAVRAGDTGIEAYVDEAKRQLMKKVFFRVSDPQYALPTRAEFSEFVSGVAPGTGSDDDAVMGILAASTKAVKKRGRGRPRKTVAPPPAE